MILSYFRWVTFHQKSGSKFVKNNSKKAKTAVAVMAGSAYGLDMYNRSVNADAYEKVPQYIKDTNFVIMNEDGTYKKFQLPYGYNVFKALGDVVAEMQHGELTLDNLPARVMGLSINAFSPIGVDSNSIVHTLSPTLIKPAYEIEANKNFFGGNIRPEDNPYSEQMPDSQKYFKSVNPFAKSIAQTMNEYSGGTMYESGAVDVSPETLEYITAFAAGGLGKLVMNTSTVIDQAFSDDEEVDMNKVPFLRKFYAVPREKTETNLIYKIYKEQGNEILPPLKLRRFAKWGDAAVQKKDITLKQWRKIRKSVIANQRKLEFAKRHNIQNLDDFNKLNIAKDLKSGIKNGGLSFSQRMKIFRELKKNNEK